MVGPPRAAAAPWAIEMADRIRNRFVSNCFRGTADRRNFQRRPKAAQCWNGLTARVNFLVPCCKALYAKRIFLVCIAQPRMAHIAFPHHGRDARQRHLHALWLRMLWAEQTKL